MTNSFPYIYLVTPCGVSRWKNDRPVGVSILLFFFRLEGYDVVLFWDVGVEPDDTHVEDVDRETDVGVLSDFVPGLLHAFGPVDVVEDDYGVFVGFGLRESAVVEGGLVLVVGVDE